MSHAARISRIDCVTREDALEFVQANLREERQARQRKQGGGDGATEGDE